MFVENSYFTMLSLAFVVSSLRVIDENKLHYSKHIYPVQPLSINSLLLTCLKESIFISYFVDGRHFNLSFVYLNMSRLFSVFYFYLVSVLNTNPYIVTATLMRF